ncbi:MAG: WD40 repeat domain-containing protein [Planctomycetia bacterium]|nr:WD40 repeat domain-containing protein [Planctomycetia bacterium]
MRVIDVCDGEIWAVAISPDSRFVGASADRVFCVFHWTTGEVVFRTQVSKFPPQIAFTPDGWAAYCVGQGLRFERLHTAAPAAARPLGPSDWYAGGVAISPDGKLFVAVLDGYPNQVKLNRWSLPTMQPLNGFDYWSPFRRLAFSPNGDFLAGISADEFELRYAVSGGFDYRHRLPEDRPRGSSGFVSFTRDSSLCAFGWESEFHILDISTGTSRMLRGTEAPSRSVVRVPKRIQSEVTEFAVPFRDAAFTGSGHHFATIEQPGRWTWWDGYENKWKITLDKGVETMGRLKLWDVQSWQLVQEYDWNCGPLTCVAFTADGLAGVCGTANGRLVQFDIDE